ncbi:MAG: DUF1559 domain-containing protein [Planctomycetaceae bacterium]
MLRSITALMMVLMCFCGSLSMGGEAEKGESADPKTYEEAVELTKQTPGFKNLQKLGLALHGYHDHFKRFPPAVLLAPNAQTYSWRVELLPVIKHYVNRIEPEKLTGEKTREEYNQLIAECGYDITEPWDSPKNADILKNIPEVFRHPDDAVDSRFSAYYAVVGTGTAFDPEQYTQYIQSQYAEELKWMSTTLMVVESRSREPWTKPVDIVYSPSGTVPRFGGFTKDGFMSLTCEGAVHFIPETTTPDALRAFLSKTTDDAFVIVGIPHQ